MSNKLPQLFWPSFAVLALVLGSIGFRSVKSKGRISTTTRVEATSESKPIAKKVVVQQEKAQPDVQGLIIALRANGFSPAEIAVPDGHYLFIVQTRVRLRDLSYRLDRDGGEKLHEVQDQKPQWKKEFDLQAGTYVLSVADHPKWRCVITVKAR